MSTRKENSLRNIQVAIIGQGIGLLISFIARRIFVETLNAEYLGLNGLFSNILSMLSLVELGVGTAIIYSLYKPLVENDTEKVMQLMKIYKKAYNIIGCVVLTGGISLTPFLSLFASDMPDIPYIEFIYILYVINSAASYFFIYKRSLIIADQKRYIATLYRYGFYAIYNIAQIVILITTKNYILYMLILVLATITENILVSHKADEMYPYLKEKCKNDLPREDRERLKKNIFAMFSHKIGGVVISGTDNLLIAKFAGIVAVGLYSNYIMITTAINGVYGLLFQSTIASIGNLNVSATKQEKLIFFENFMFIGSWMYGFATISLLCLFNSVITIWLGEDYNFNFGIVCLIVFNFYLTGMRQPLLTTRDAMGLFWNDRYKPLFESLVNIAVSIILGKYYGIIGILIGTSVSTLTVCFWVEPFILYKYGFQAEMRKYFKKYFLYTLVTLLALIITYLLCNQVDDSGELTVLIRLLICLVIPNLIYSIFYHKTKEFKYATTLLKQFFMQTIVKIKQV